MCNQGACTEWTHAGNIQAIKTCPTNVCAIKSYVQLIHMTNPATAQVT